MLRPSQTARRRKKGMKKRKKRTNSVRHLSEQMIRKLLKNVNGNDQFKEMGIGTILMTFMEDNVVGDEDEGSEDDELLEEKSFRILTGRRIQRKKGKVAMETETVQVRKGRGGGGDWQPSANAR